MGQDKNMVRFFTFSQFHNKRPPTGSTQIRVNQLIKYWDEADIYKYGENPDVLIFQKVYCAPDYQFPKHFEGKKILDICDPDWLDNFSVKATVDAVDAITCPTYPIKDFLKQLTDKPIVVIPDRFDLEVLPPPRPYTTSAKTVVWFGYSHNQDLLKPAIRYIKDLNLNLLVISEQDFGYAKWGMERSKYQFIKYNESTIYRDLQKADICILPKGTRPVDVFKSNNKTIKANLAGLPVANTIELLEKYLDPVERKKWFDTTYDNIKKEYDVQKSVEQMKELINEL